MTTPSNTPAPSPEPGAGTVPAGSGQAAPDAAPTAPYAGDPYAGAPYTAAPDAYATASYGPPPSYVSAPDAAAPARPARNVMGIVALVIGAVLLLSSTISLVAQAFLIRAADYVLISTVLAGFSTLQGILAVAGVVCGSIGLALKGRPKGAAGVGLGIGVAVLWSVLGSFLFGALVQLLG